MARSSAGMGSGSFRRRQFALLVKILVVLVVAVIPAWGAGGDVVWEYGDVRAGKQEPVVSAVDRNGNVILAGFRNVAGAANDDYWTVKFKGDGSGIAWQASYDKAQGTDQVAAVVVDGNNNVIVTGFVGNGVNRDIHTIKYNGGTGAVMWQATYNGAANGNDTGAAVAVDSLNNVYVGGTTQNSAGNDDYIVLKYNADGVNGNGTLAWQATYDGGFGGNDQLTDLAVGPDGLAVTGQSRNGAVFNMVTLKYDFDGAVTWPAAVRYAPPGDATGRKVQIDGAGNVIATGIAGNGIDLDIYTVKYGDSTGAIIWERPFNGAYNDEPYSLQLDSNGDVYVAGYTWTLTGTNDFYTARYSGTNGAVVWEQFFDAGDDSTDIAIATSLSLDEGGDVFVTGYTSLAGNYDFQTIKYKRDNGNELWRKSFNGSADGNDRPVGVGFTADGKVLVAGWSENGTDADCYVIAYDSGAINPPTLLAATTLSTTSIRLQWADNSGNEEGFTVERRKGEVGNFVPIITPGLPGTVGPNVTSYTDTDPDLLENTYYYYRIKANNSVTGDSHYSNEAHALTVFVTFLPPAWAYLYNNPDNMDDYPNGIAVGPDNNPVVTGYSQRTVGGFDYYTVKMDRSDRSVIWSDLYDSPDSEMDVAKCIAVDGNDNVVVSGFSQLYNSAARKNINSIFTIKYRADVPAVNPPIKRWSAQYNGPGAIDDRATAIAATTDTANNIVVLGYGKNAANNDDIYVVKYNADGTRAWAATPFEGSGGDDIPSALAIAPDGSVYVAGYSERGANTNLYSFFTAKYDGATGAMIWWEIYSVTPGGNNQAKDIAVDAAGDVYVTGFATGATGQKDFYTIKYSGSGSTPVRLWEYPYDGIAGGDDTAVGVKVDPIDGSVVVAGTTLSHTGDHDLTVVRYAPGGAKLWERTQQRPGNDDFATALALDASGYIYIAGNTSNGTTMDIVSLLYQSDGTLLKATLFNGAANGNDEAAAIVANHKGEAFIAGYSTNAAGNADYLVLKQVNDFILVPAPFIAAPVLAPQVDYSKINLTWSNNTAGMTLRIDRTLGPITGDNVWTFRTNAPAGATTFQDTGLNANTGYCYRIKAFNETLASREIVNCITTLPVPPTLNPLTVVAPARLELSWNNVPGNNGYLVERSLDNVTWLALAALPADTTSYPDTGVGAGTVYYYRVSATSVTGPSAPSNVQINPALNAPSAVSPTKIDLSWPSVGGNTGYLLERSLDNVAWTQIKAASQGATAYSDLEAVPGAIHYYRIKAVTASGLYGPGFVRSAITPLPAPALNPTATVSTSQIDLTWSGVAGATGYTVWESSCLRHPDENVCTSSYLGNSYAWGGWTQVGTTTGGGATSFPRTGLPASRAYLYRIVATSDISSSAGSNEVLVWTKPDAPTNLSLSAPTSSSVELSWSDVNGDNGYTVEHKLGAGGSWVVVANPVRNQAVVTDEGLITQTEYFYRVKANNLTSSSAWSEERSITTPVPGPAVTSVVASSTAQQIVVTWNNLTGNTGYEVRRSYSASGWSTWQTVSISVPQDTFTFTDQSTSPGYTYRYSVRAKMGAGAPTGWGSDGGVQATTIPAVPGNFRATGVSPTQIDLAWYGSAGATSYLLQYKARSGADCTAGTWTDVTRSQNQTSWTASSLIPGLGYCFQVRATNGTGSSSYAALTMLPAPTLDPPSDITSSSVTLTWGPTVAGNSGYVVERSTDNVTFSQLISVGTDVLTHVDTTVASNSTYYYRIRTMFNSQRSVPSLTKSATTQAAQSPTLDPLTVTASGTGIALTWNNIPGNVGYKVERSLDNVTWTTVVTQAQDLSSYTNEQLTAGTLYYYRVSTKNSATSFSVPSNVRSTTTRPRFPTPVAPRTNLALTMITEAQFDLTWRVVLGATNYKIKRSVGSAGPWTDLADLPVGYTTLYCGTLATPTMGCPVLEPAYTRHLDSGLTENTEYCYQLTAWNASGGESAPSDGSPVCLKTPAVGGPAEVAASALTSMSVLVSWTYNPGACSPVPCEAPDGFELWRQVGNGTFTRWKTLFNASSYMDRTGVEPQKSYSYKVRGFRGSDLSPFSTTATATTPPYAAEDATCTTLPGNTPVIGSVPATSVIEGEPYSYAVTATVPGGGTPAFTLATSPSGMTISAGGVISWTPTHGQIGNQNVTVRATDGAGRFADQNFTVTVYRINHLPVVTSTAVTTGGTGVEYNYTVTATDADGDPLTFTLMTAPEGMSISSGGTITWLPGSNQSGTRSVSVRVSDGIGAVSHDFTIQVAANQPPFITSTAPAVGMEGSLYSYPVVATDPNSLPLTYSLTGAPATMTVSASGLITWTPDLFQAEKPSPTVTVTVRNSIGLSVSETFTIVVADSPRPPVVTSTAVPNCALGATYTYQIVATDPDNLPLVYELPLNAFPAGMTVSAAGLVTWTPTSGQLGSNSVTVKIKDANVFTNHTFTILVAVAPSVPTVNQTGNIDTGCGGTVPVTLSWNAATAPDGHAVEYAVSIDGGTQLPWQSATGYTFSTSGNHSWRVKTKDTVTALESPWSATVSFSDYQSCGGSCPDLYAWNGTEFTFESDLYGSGKLGTAIAGGFIKPNPNDYYLLRTMPAPNRDGDLELRLVEDRWETDYLDSAHLYAIDMPEDRDLYAEIPILGAGYSPILSMVHTVSKNLQLPVSMVHVNSGDEVSPILAASDGNYLILSQDRDLFEWHTLELDLGDLSQAPAIKLVIDAQSVFPSTSTARLGQLAINGQRTLIQVLDGNGQWVTVPKETLQMPTPKEFRRPFVLNISNIFPTTNRKVRLAFMFKTYVDSIRLDTTADAPVTVTEVPLRAATLEYHGTNSRTSYDEIYGYTYDRIADYGYGHMPGKYTRYGNVDALITAADDQFALFGTGDQLRLVFRQPAGVPPGAGRRFMLYTNGYYKSYNNKSISRTVEPLPFAAMTNFPYSAPEAYPTDEAHEQYRLLYNTRELTQ